ncbi:MAG: multifunctional CCA addition/repair protein [Betaproteobacteria bacterium]|nr:multifunctional CCA addition/repair protein [Betaproteobacteria bacterium]
MKIHAVGGSVRDQLLGLAVQDHDYVVVGATPEEMIAAGYKPVGADFPVFLHPVRHDEYALARTERKTAPGYKGFVFHTSPDVTIEQDLGRRDLTINAIARAEDGTLIDPFDGVGDLKKGILRHVGDAFVEDPVRILRVARFAARFAARGFFVADETVALMRRMVDNGEVDHLVPERVWQELSRGLMEASPSRMFEVLRQCGALARILPEVDRLWGVPQSANSHPEIDTGVHVMMVVDYAAFRRFSLPIRFAALVHDLGKGITAEKYLPRHPGHEEKSVELCDAMCARIKVPAECRDLGRIAARWHGEAHNALKLDASKLLALLDGTDALRRPARFHDFVESCACDHHGRLGFADAPYPQRDYLHAALHALQQLDFASTAAKAQQSGVADIGAAIQSAKLEHLRKFIEERKVA